MVKRTYKNITSIFQRTQFSTVQYKVVVHHPDDKLVTLTVSSREQLSNLDSNTTFEIVKCLKYI
jgi:hypothetical protein